MSRAYYNEIDVNAAAWLRELIKNGHIADGDVDTRSIEDVRPRDLIGYTQCHFFAGIGIWSHALRTAGWSDHRPVWTGSCPCQPFSQTGKGLGFTDERHLWPAFHWLIEQCRPPVIFGEQVASKAGLAWVDLIQTDLEGTDYAFAATDLCAAGVGAPHVRQRLYWVANSNVIAGKQGCTDNGRRDQGSDEEPRAGLGSSCVPMFLGDTDGQRLARRSSKPAHHGEKQSSIERASRDAFWSNAEWIECRDGKSRAIEPGTCPLVNGHPQRVGLLRGYGNAIVAPLATEVISAFMEIEKR